MQLLEISSVFGLAMIEIWAAVPAGFLLKMNSLQVFLVVSIGAITGQLAVLLIGAPLRKWLIVFENKKHESKQTHFSKLWEKFGVRGIGFFAPLLTGAPIGIAMGLAFGAEPKALTIWMIAGTLFWTGFLTLLGQSGINFFHT